MKMLYEAYTEPEPHFAQILKADAHHADRGLSEGREPRPECGLGRDADRRHPQRQQGGSQDVAIRSGSCPTPSRSSQGDDVTIHVTNVEQTTDMIHGLGIIEHDMNVVMDPGETKTVKFKAGKPGVYPFYCTNFCSALHQEMQGYLAVKPQAALNPSTAATTTVGDDKGVTSYPRLAALHRMLDRPVIVTGRVILLLGMAALLAGGVLPLWRISLVAPQYPEGLTLDMYTYRSSPATTARTSPRSTPSTTTSACGRSRRRISWR